MDMWMQVLSEFGFPAAITFYLLYRIEKKLDVLNASLLHLHSGRTAAHPAAAPPRMQKQTDIM
ncbi:YvrJ family protein [Alkalicoccus chagannorensis]|uniref:YvrJ family protein n=1 Tax=Alkalicoccus chagannorensis TaxID=427072 RepID=UPI000416F0E5|nr:YvrJ family protein [Alkalicoccus chagannorensis]